MSVTSSKFSILNQNVEEFTNSKVITVLHNLSIYPLQIRVLIDTYVLGSFGLGGLGDGGFGIGTSTIEGVLEESPFNFSVLQTANQFTVILSAATSGRIVYWT